MDVIDADALLDALDNEQQSALRERRSVAAEDNRLYVLDDRLARRCWADSNLRGDTEFFLSVWADDFIDYAAAILGSRRCCHRWEEIDDVLWGVPPAIAAVSKRVYLLAGARDKAALIGDLRKIMLRTPAVRDEIEAVIRRRIAVFLRMGRTENVALTGEPKPVDIPRTDDELQDFARRSAEHAALGAGLAADAGTNNVMRQMRKPARDSDSRGLSPPQPPKKLLKGWHDICAALDHQHDRYREIVRLNDSYKGPITNKGRGTRPTVYKDDLLEWFNNLAIRHQELENQQDGKELSVASQHGHGKCAPGTSGAVVPDIKGSVKRRWNNRT